MTVPWSCDPWLPHLTGAVWGGVAGLVIGWALGRWDRRGGKIEIYRTFDHSQTPGEGDNPTGL